MNPSLDCEMVGTKEHPFLESAATCSFCLDFNSSFLRRQWRRFGSLYPVDVPFGFTIPKLSENLESTGCAGCSLLMKAAAVVTQEFGIEFHDAILEYEGRNVCGEGLSLTFSSLHPVHVDDVVLEKARSTPGLKTELITAPSAGDPSRKHEKRISSPVYEIFVNTSKTGNPSASLTFDGTALRLWPSRCGDTGSVAALGWAMAQIKHCRAEHAICASSNAHWSLPTRVIDLGEDLADLKSPSRLYESAGEQATYVCLSHCWGGNVPIQTNSKTFNDFKKVIQWSTLPKTFQDAIIFTRRLGIRYLWIDSLCIIQDDDEDWFTEAGRMASIYEHAEVTLSAASSTNSSEGLFRRSDVGACLDPEHNIWVRQRPDPEFFERAGEFIMGSKSVSPLLKRAWVFQERLLSRRVLHFTPWELVLECKTSNAAESGQDWIDTTDKHSLRMIYDASSASVWTKSDLWRHLVTSFTHLGLTKAGDTLPAMAGLASRMFQLEGLSHNYLAGLWKHQLLDDLLWSWNRLGPHEINKTMPTWSWARSTGGKSFIRPTENVALCKVVEAVCTSTRGDQHTFLHVDGGHVLIRGHVIPARHTRSGIVVMDVPRVFHMVKKDYLWHEPPEPEPMLKDQSLAFLPIAPSLHDDGLKIIALTLLAVGHVGTEKVYRRVGIAHMQSLYLQPYNYVFGPETTLATYLKSQISLAESILVDGRYSYSREMPSMREGASKSHTRLQDSTFFEHMCLYGGEGHPEISLQTFSGRPHLNLLRKQLREEEDRIEAWRRAEETRTDHAHEPQLIKII